MRHIQRVVLILAALLAEKSYSEGQTLDFTSTSYISVGGNITYHYGSTRKISFGPEIAYGYIYSDPFFSSVNLGAAFFTKNGGFELFTKIQYGTWYMGGSTGVVYMSREHKSRMGLQSDIWTGAAAYLMESFLWIPDYSGFSTTGKIRIPIPLAQPSNPNFRAVLN